MRFFAVLFIGLFLQNESFIVTVLYLTNKLLFEDVLGVLKNLKHTKSINLKNNSVHFCKYFYRIVYNSF